MGRRTRLHPGVRVPGAAAPLGPLPPPPPPPTRALTSRCSSSSSRSRVPAKAQARVPPPPMSTVYCCTRTRSAAGLTRLQRKTGVEAAGAGQATHGWAMVARPGRALEPQLLQCAARGTRCRAPPTHPSTTKEPCAPHSTSRRRSNGSTCGSGGGRPRWVAGWQAAGRSSLPAGRSHISPHQPCTTAPHPRGPAGAPAGW